MAGSLKTLVAEGVVSSEKDLSEAEAEVLDNLSDEEVKVLVGMRQRLDDAQARLGGGAAGIGDQPFSPSPNIIV